MIIPDDFSEEEKKTGMLWKQLAAGGLAGVSKLRYHVNEISRCMCFLLVLKGNRHKIRNKNSYLNGILVFSAFFINKEENFHKFSGFIPISSFSTYSINLLFPDIF